MMFFFLYVVWYIIGNKRIEITFLDHLYIFQTFYSVQISLIYDNIGFKLQF